jgi:glycosyltransferase involved in cell wall biosynthesis
VTVAVLACVLSADGYFRYRFDVLKLMLAAMRVNTQVEHDLMVFDNGSYPEVGEYLNGLKEQGAIDYLVQSKRNIGNFGALRMMFNSAPGEVIAYLDDDVFVYPGWLKNQLKILEIFPQVGMVSGVPVRMAARHASESLNSLLENPPAGLQVLPGRHIPDEWEYDWAVSTGRRADEFMEETRGWEDMLLRYNQVEAIGSANHFQFVGYREVLKQGLPDSWDQRLMGDMVEFDQRLDGLGYLRLSTPDRFVRHIGNTINAELSAEAEALGLDSVRVGEIPFTKKHWILYLPRSRKILKAIYNWLFKVLFLHDKLK